MVLNQKKTHHIYKDLKLPLSERLKKVYRQWQKEKI